MNGIHGDATLGRTATSSHDGTGKGRGETRPWSRKTSVRQGAAKGGRQTKAAPTYDPFRSTATVYHFRAECLRAPSVARSFAACHHPLLPRHAAPDPSPAM